MTHTPIASPIITLLAAMLATAATTSTYSATVFRCVDSAGRVTMQDTPCSGTSGTQTIKVDGPPVHDTDFTLRTLVDYTNAQMPACRGVDSKYCDDLRKLSASVRELSATSVAAKDRKIAAELALKSAIASARVEHRIAKDDYARADAALANYNSATFNTHLRERSEAHDRMLRASRTHYALTKRWLE